MQAHRSSFSQHCHVGQDDRCSFVSWQAASSVRCAAHVDIAAELDPFVSPLVGAT